MERTSRLVREKFMGNLVATLGMVGSVAIASIVDKIMVGSLLGGTALAALNLNSPVICVMNVIFCFFVFGGNTLAVTVKAERDQAKANKAFTIAVALGTAILAVIAAVGIIFQSQVAGVLCGNDAQLQGPVTDYLVPLLVLGALMIPVNGTSAFVRVDGLSNLAVVIPVVANVVNLLCDYIFMGILHLGIASAGWATNAGYIAGVLCLIPYFRSEKRGFFFTPIGFKDMAMVIETIKTGLSSALADLCLLIQALTMNLIILSVFGATGAQVLAVCTSALSISGILYMGTTQTMLPLGGALYGEKDYTGLREVMRFGVIITEVFLVIYVVILWIFTRPFGSIFGVTSPEALGMLDVAFPLFLISIPFVGFQECLRVTLQCTGRENVASVMAALSGTLCFVPVIWLFSIYAPDYLWISFAIASFLAIGGCLVYLYFKARKTGMKFGTLIPKSAETAETIEFSIRNTIDDAEAATRKTVELCREKGLEEKYAQYMGVAVEEMCTNIAKYAYKDREDDIDIFLRITAEEVLLRIRDNGVIFNPTEYKDDNGEEVTGLKLLNQMPLKVEYNRVLGFNNTIITMRVNG